MIGRLLYDTGSLPEGKVEELRRASARRHVPIEWSFALDALQAERDQAVTIDTTQIWFNSESRSYTWSRIGWSSTSLPPAASN